LVLTVVIDTNIYISAIFWNGKPREVIDLGREGKIMIFTSVDIENEIARKLKTKFKLAEEDANQILLDFSTFTLPPVRAIIDAGANTGQFARMIEKIFPEANIYCFEPLGEGFQLRGRREGVKKARKSSLSPFYVV
jgi:hypothetical protein